MGRQASPLAKLELTVEDFYQVWYVLTCLGDRELCVIRPAACLRDEGGIRGGRGRIGRACVVAPCGEVSRFGQRVLVDITIEPGESHWSSFMAGRDRDSSIRPFIRT